MDDRSDHATVSRGSSGKPVAVAVTTDPPGAGSPTLSTLNVGVVVWLASELMFFAGLFAAYFTLRSTNQTWPPDDVELEVARTAAATAVLVASSATMHQAVRAAEQGARRSAIVWLGVTGVLGLLFLTNQVTEYASASFSWTDNAYGSIFYLMTGFHGLHVLGGLIFMAAVAAVIAGRSRAPVGPTVEVCGYYWHFVDVVWVAMFATIYLLQ
jgi:cytochrome c oxidase subunit 3